VGLRGLLLTDLFLGLLAVLVVVRTPVALRRIWARTRPGTALVGLVIAGASPLLWFAMFLALPSGTGSIRWLFLGQWTYNSAVGFVVGMAQYRVARLQADLL
jgi:hypothetical protein